MQDMLDAMDYYMQENVWILVSLCCCVSITNVVLYIYTAKAQLWFWKKTVPQINLGIC